MNRLEFTMRELGGLYEMYRAIKRYKISPTKAAFPKKQKDLSQVDASRSGESLPRTASATSSNPVFDTPAGSR